MNSKPTMTAKDRMHRIIFGTDTRLGRLFDVILLWAIILSVTAVSLESIKSIGTKYAEELRYIEWGFTILFTIEYGVRLWVVENRRKYALSFFGLVDLISIIPTYLSLFLVGTQALIVVRSLRLLRVFRVLKLAQFVGHGNQLAAALAASRYKISVFLVGVVTMNLIIGTTMYLIEGEGSGFTSIPTSVYWSIVTMTTVGYGDIAPQTPLGQTLASLAMILGYGIIAVPTGIVTGELTSMSLAEKEGRDCKVCRKLVRPHDANFCPWCGEPRT